MTHQCHWRWFTGDVSIGSWRGRSRVSRDGSRERHQHECREGCQGRCREGQDHRVVNVCVRNRCCANHALSGGLGACPPPRKITTTVGGREELHTVPNWSFAIKISPCTLSIALSVTTPSAPRRGPRDPGWP